MNKNVNEIFSESFHEAEKLYKEKNYLESLIKYKKILNLNPNHVSVLNNIALNYEKLDNYNEAINYYEKCIQIVPKEIIIIHNLANAYCKTERYLDALPLLKKIINLDYKNEPNHEKLALCLFYTQTKNETKNFIELAIIKFPKNTLLNGLLGKTLLHLNLHKDGLKYLQKSTGVIEFNNSGLKYLS